MQLKLILTFVWGETRHYESLRVFTTHHHQHQHQQCGTIGKFSKNLRDPFSVEYSMRVQRPFRLWDRAGSFKCSESRQPQKVWGLFSCSFFFFLYFMLSLSVSNSMYVCVWLFFFFDNKCNCFLVVWGGVGAVMMSLTGLFVCGAS